MGCELGLRLHGVALERSLRGAGAAGLAGRDHPAAIGGLLPGCGVVGGLGADGFDFDVKSWLGGRSQDEVEFGAGDQLGFVDDVGRCKLRVGQELVGDGEFVDALDEAGDLAAANLAVSGDRLLEAGVKAVATR